MIAAVWRYTSAMIGGLELHQACRTAAVTTRHMMQSPARVTWKKPSVLGLWEQVFSMTSTNVPI